MASITIQGVDSINDFWCYLNSKKDQAYVASGDGVNPAEIPWKSPDFMEVNVRYGLQDYLLWQIGYDQYQTLSRIYIVRDHRQETTGKYTYYFFDSPLHKADA